MKIFIKNMVSDRCKTVVQNELKVLGIIHHVTELGEIEISKKLTEEQQLDLKRNLLKHGLELVHDPKVTLVEKIRNLIIEMVHYLEKRPITNYSAYISRKLDYDYTYLANLFSEVQGTTIEHCIIAHKIERVKELLTYNQFSLTEIANKLHYSSVSHLAKQFKKVTGITTSEFKKQEYKGRLTLDKVC